MKTVITAKLKLKTTSEQFAQLRRTQLAYRDALNYKAPLHKSIAIKVDAGYTSKACPMCGHICDGNRPKHGLLFVCQNCHYTLHADLIGARSITMRTLLVRQDWIRTGQLSVAPESSDSDVSSVEAKAARLKRYAELRWSLDTSPA